jgi:hypothetical protein
VNPLKKFMLGTLRLPLLGQAWLMALMAANMIVPLLYLGRWEARIVLATFMVSFLLMLILTAASGFTRLLGLGHTLWIPLVIYLVTRLDSVPGGDGYGLWLRAVIVLNSISLVMDVWDVIRYARGERSEVVSFEA